MSLWNDTYESKELRIDGYDASVDVFTAIGSSGYLERKGVIAKLQIKVSTEHGDSTSSVELTPAQMRELASMLNAAADRAERLAAAHIESPRPARQTMEALAA